MAIFFYYFFQYFFAKKEEAQDIVSLLYHEHKAVENHMLNVESEKYYISVFDNIILSFHAHESFFSCRRK